MRAQLPACGHAQSDHPGAGGDGEDAVRSARRPGRRRIFIEAGIEQEVAAFFFTESRWQSLVKQLQKEGKPIPPRPAGAPTAERAVPLAQWQEPADCATLARWV